MPAPIRTPDPAAVSAARAWLERERPAPRHTVRIVFSLVALVLAPASWFLSIDDARLRATGSTVWMMYAAALFLALSAAWRDRRRWVRVVAAAELVLVGLSVWAFFGLAALPGAAPPERAPDFTLPDAEGRPVTLSEELVRGPVLLVFFRGHW